MPIGTSVHLTPRYDHADLLRPAAVAQLARDFGEFLPVRVTIGMPGGDVDVTRPAPFLGEGDADEALAYGRDPIGSTPMGVIEISEPATGTRGLAYVLPFAPPPNLRQATRTYLGRMLLAERSAEVLPDCAFFVRAVVDSTGLSPTASRESLVEDAALEHVREQLGAGIRRWVLELGLTAPHLLTQFVAVHELGLKSLVRHDEELARFITRWLTVETAHGSVRIGDLVERHRHIRYARTVDEFRQVAGIVPASEVLVNGGRRPHRRRVRRAGRLGLAHAAPCPDADAGGCTLGRTDPVGRVRGRDAVGRTAGCRGMVRTSAGAGRVRLGARCAGSRRSRRRARGRRAASAPARAADRRARVAGGVGHGRGAHAAACGDAAGSRAL